MVGNSLQARRDEISLKMKMPCNEVVAIAAVLILTMGGCGAGDSLSLASVEGLVTLDGEPLGDARVIFSPEDGRRPSSAVTESDGSYKLTYLEDQPGALPGRHKVIISTFVEADPDSSDPRVKTGVREILPTKYNTQTTLEAQLEPGQREEVNFELTSR